MLYSARIAGREGLIYVLWEHKSEPKALTALQVLRYLVLADLVLTRTGDLCSSSS